MSLIDFHSTYPALKERDKSYHSNPPFNLPICQSPDSSSSSLENGSPSNLACFQDGGTTLAHLCLFQLPGRSTISHTRTPVTHQPCARVLNWRILRNEDVFAGVGKWHDASHSFHQLAHWQTFSWLLITVSGTHTRIDETERDSRVFAIDCPDSQCIYFIARQPVRL